VTDEKKLTPVEVLEKAYAEMPEDLREEAAPWLFEVARILQAQKVESPRLTAALALAGLSVGFRMMREITEDLPDSQVNKEPLVDTIRMFESQIFGTAAWLAGDKDALNVEKIDAYMKELHGKEEGS
jgi:hypothetical protein